MKEMMLRRGQQPARFEPMTSFTWCKLIYHCATTAAPKFVLLKEWLRKQFSLLCYFFQPESEVIPRNHLIQLFWFFDAPEIQIIPVLANRKRGSTTKVRWTFFRPTHMANRVQVVLTQGTLGSLAKLGYVHHRILLQVSSIAVKKV